MDRLLAMHLFVRVAELSSFSAVAQQMGLARSAVTRQIAALERHLGTKLMVRSTRRMMLTSEGAAYLEKCRVILNLVEAAETGVAEERQTPRGMIRISLPLTYGLMRVAPLLMEFARRYPEVQLDMDYTDRRVNLIEEAIDLSIRITARLGATEIARRISSSKMSVVASPGYLAEHGTPRHPSELVHHECLSYTTTAESKQTWSFDVNGALTAFPIRARIHSNNGEALNDAVERGLGIALQPDFIIEKALQTGKVVPILANYTLPELGIYAILPSNRQVPHRVRVLMDYLADHLR
ncbi:MAG: LysR family transcriptional regulator [Oxalobacteraceae bacterium]|jgi:DNA-binding transcriptional LysR family regulator|nr:LysR family transcriptional regulator [Oxalobacteraceae bacterium]